MIFVILGTQDKDFSRLLIAMEKWIDEYQIKDRVVVQAGQTKYKSGTMEILDFIDMDSFEQLIEEASVIVTHGGVGTIITALNHNKTVIATPRLAKYHEHHNDHQIQIIETFEEKGHLIYLRDLDKIQEAMIQAESFKPEPYQSNRDQLVKILMDYINQI